jgi:hypothetical protein
MATTHDMSQDNPPSDLNDGFVKFMSRIFAPMLKDDFSKHVSPFAIENPLTAESFYINKDTNTPFEEIEKVQDILSDSFHLGLTTLTHNQWMCTATLVVVAIIDGLCSSCLDNLSPVPFTNLNPDETNSMNVLGKAIGALEHYFTDPLAEHPIQWQQCLRCLKVLHSDPTPTFSDTAPSIYTPTYETPDTWDCITVVSDFPNVVPTHPLNILPHVAPEPITIRSLMHSWPYTTHCFTEFRPRRTDGDSTELWLAPRGHFTHAHTLEHSTFC